MVIEVGVDDLGNGHFEDPVRKDGPGPGQGHGRLVFDSFKSG